MALTSIQDAHDVMHLLEFVLGLSRHGRTVSPEEARDAAVRLNEAAKKKLQTGIPRAELEEAWATKYSEADERPKVAADVVLFARHENRWHVLLIQRDWPPFESMWALPGGHVDPGESSVQAALRELTEETGVPAGDIEPVLVGVYDKPGRDPRGWYWSAAYMAVAEGLPEPTAADDARAARWVPVQEAFASKLAFDHGDILVDAYSLVGSAPVVQATATPGAVSREPRPGDRVRVTWKASGMIVESIVDVHGNFRGKNARSLYPDDIMVEVIEEA